VFFIDFIGAESWWNAAKRNKIIKSKASPKAISLGGEKTGRIAEHKQQCEEIEGSGGREWKEGGRKDRRADLGKFVPSCKDR
jgi:hypothetical protein